VVHERRRRSAHGRGHVPQRVEELQVASCRRAAEARREVPNFCIGLAPNRRGGGARWRGALEAAANRLTMELPTASVAVEYRRLLWQHLTVPEGHAGARVRGATYHPLGCHARQVVRAPVELRHGLAAW